ncbi:MAG TPA: phenylalanine--tRNA ligase subunit beta [Verrucomicrobiae bacterium]|mgnify:CR=1 FL=1|nr:phenylalanine--tRNA ligase subunit beta [Verrucomicrobiae bacterium]
MKVSLEWLGDFVVIEADVSRVVDALTMAGIEVEGVQATGVSLEGVVVCEVKTVARHPNADRLTICEVEMGSGSRRIVCGAKNFKAGDRVPLALAGAVLPGGFTIKESKIRGELSQGMMCSGRELGVSDDQDGLLILPGNAPVGAPISRLFPPDTVLDLEVTPNRPDLLSHEGIARELVACGLARWRENRPGKGAGPGVADRGFSVDVASLEDCPCYTATVIDGVRVGESPDWLKRRLSAVGLRPINNIVDITNCVLLELGQPMHAFDRDRLAPADRIVVRRARPGEKLVALDHKEYAVGPEDIVIADGNRPVALGGVIGGEPTAVTAETVAIVLEVARFLPAAIRRTSRRLEVATDSSYRFERGTDPALVERARSRALGLILELAGGRVTAGGAAGSHAAPEREIPLRVARAAGVLGVDHGMATIRASLEGIGCSVEDAGVGAVRCRVPSWRGDLVREIDLIEEVARITGIDAVPSRAVLSPAPESPADRDYDVRMGWRRRLAGMGFSEIVLGPLGDSPEDSERLSNPMISGQVSLRRSLRQQTLRVVAENLDQGNASVRLFHIGRVFGEGDERWHLALAVAGPDHEPHWGGAPRAMDLFDLKGALDALGLSPALAQTVGRPELKALGIRGSAAYADVALPVTGATVRRFRPWAVYPAVERDVAVVVPRGIAHAEVERAFAEAKEPLLERVTLFDIFSDDTGERLPQDRKSMAYSVRYRSPDRTLTDQEVNGAHEALKVALKRRLGCEFRE